jgi:hypothetical protein
VLSIQDTAANVGSSLDALQTLAQAGKLAHIALSDGGTPTFTLSADQLVSDAQALHAINGSFAVTAPNVSNGMAQFIIQQDQAIRGGNGLHLDYALSAGNPPAGANAVTGFQSAIFTGGYNAVVLDHARANYSVQVGSDGKTTIKDIGSGDADFGKSVTVSGASYLVFDGAKADASGNYSSIYFLANNNNAAVAELYAAALGRQPDLAGLEYWENQHSSGMALQNIASSFVASDEFKTKFAAAAAASDNGGANDKAFIAALYQNVLHRAPDDAGYAYWVADFQKGDVRGNVLIDFAIGAENVANTNATAGNGSHWLINTSNGGYADASAGSASTQVALVGIDLHQAHALA